jgi:hypothetical protein
MFPLKYISEGYVELHIPRYYWTTIHLLLPYCPMPAHAGSLRRGANYTFAAKFERLAEVKPETFSAKEPVK